MMKAKTGKKVLIVGGGIGGLAASLSLARQGFEVALFEQTPEINETGAGIQLSPNCTRVLFDVGLESALRPVAFLPEGGEMRDWKSGRVIAQSKLGSSAIHEYGFPYYHVHRADLIGLLENAAREHDSIEVVPDTRVTEFDQQPDGVTITTAAKETCRGHMLIGADGIHSMVRAQLFGAEAPVFTGNVAWRALVPVARLPRDLIRPMATVWWGPGGHFVHYYVRGGELLNCVCVTEKQGWQVESWTERGDYSELKADFAGWHPDIQELIDQTDRDSLFKWALFDRRPMSSWGRGRVTLLGDACHPTLPFMAQGAAMAIEDGAVLARCLNGTGTIDANLKQYEALRRQRTAGVQSGSRRNAKVFHLRGIKARLRNLAAARASGGAMERLFRYNALTAHQEI